MLWLAIPVLAYIALVTSVWLAQESLVFPGARRGRGLTLPQVPGVTVSALRTSAGARFRVATAEPAGRARGVLLVFLGNGDDLAAGVHVASELTEYGVSTVVTEYPGYGESDGRPTVPGFLAAADAAADFAQQKATALNVPLLVAGTSLGTFSAVHVASQGRGTRLLLAAPPTSILEAARERYPWFPIRWLLRYRFDNMANASRVTCPVLVVHGDADTVVPLAHGRRVAEALRAEFVVLPGVGHVWLLGKGGPAGSRIAKFLAGE
jgi:pimeloyl-ACP methyl ester carboxylesterase